MAETLTGTVERITFRSAESGFSVLRVVEDEGDLVTVVGVLPEIFEGERIRAEGEWKDDAKFGIQFAASAVTPELPTTAAAIERYLGSGAVSGVGPHLAKLLIRQFGTDVLTVLDEEPKKLLRIRGIGPRKLKTISESWSEQKGVRQLLLFLAEYGIGSGRAHRIWKQYGANSIAVIRENPYRLAAEVRGIGFTIADAIARKLGLPPDSPFRIAAALRYLLDEARGSGHCATPRDALLEQGVALLGVDPSLVERGLETELAQRTLLVDQVDGVELVFLPWLWNAERSIAERLVALSAGSPPWPEIDAERAIDWVSKQARIDLSASQRDAIRLMLRSKVCVITGGPGVGKTTLVNSIIRILEAKEIDIALAAPTGRAARRLTETTSLPAKTIHRLLEVSAESGRFARDEDAPLECDLVVIDETSMVDVPLMDSLLRALPPHAALLLVGDADQLPSVGPGQVLSDIIDSGAVPVVRLTEVFRQASESSIVMNAHRVNRGEMPDLGLSRRDPEELSDFYFVSVDGAESAVRRVVQLVSERIPKRFGFDPSIDVQVLTPMNRGTAGVEGLNRALQQTLNARGLAGARLEKGPHVFAIGDKVMQIENDYDRDVFNGDVGIVRAIDEDEGTLAASFYGRKVEYGRDELDILVPAYACTIHKSQGSEYPAVIVVLLRQHAIMLQRNLLYTAITRGRRLVVIVGEPEAVGIAVSNRRAGRRHSSLRQRLSSG